MVENKIGLFSNGLMDQMNPYFFKCNTKCSDPAPRVHLHCHKVQSTLKKLDICSSVCTTASRIKADGSMPLLVAVVPGVNSYSVCSCHEREQFLLLTQILKLHVVLCLKLWKINHSYTQHLQRVWKGTTSRGSVKIQEETGKFYSCYKLHSSILNTIFILWSFQ